MGPDKSHVQPKKVTTLSNLFLDTWDILFYGEDPEKDTTAQATDTEEFKLEKKELLNPTMVQAKKPKGKQRQWIPDGSILAVKDLWKDMNNDDDFTKSGMNPAQPVVDDAAWEGAGSGTSLGKGKSRARGDESVLKIFVADDEFEWV